jgi:hypothetical protein
VTASRSHRIVVASDLDQTLLFTRRAAPGVPPAAGSIEVERTEGGDAVTEMSASLAALLTRLPDNVDFVPATTRTVAQFSRLRLPGRPRTVVAASGGIVLTDGRPDPHWAEHVRARTGSCASLSEVDKVLAGFDGAAWLLRRRTADALFLYAIVRPELLRAGDFPVLVEQCASLDWRVVLHGRKCYLMPAWIDKAGAVAHVRERLVPRGNGGTELYAAGDSLLDLQMLRAADRSWVLRHSELDRAGALGNMPSAHRTASPGRAGSEEIGAAWAALLQLSQPTHR